VVFDWTRRIVYAGMVDRVADALALRDGERLLDLGCGTGFASQLGPTQYVGIDQTPDLLAAARRRRPAARSGFAAMSGDALGFRTGAFDKAVCIHVVHHLDTPLLDAVLRELRRVVRGPVILVDVAPDIANRFERFLLAHDRGEHIRSRDELRAILTRWYRVEREHVFHDTLRTAPQALFRLLPSAEP